MMVKLKQSHWRAATICLAAVLGASCASTPKQAAQEKLIGTWANSEYLGGRSYTPWKITYNSDGTASRSNFDAPAGPVRVARYLVEKTWPGEDGSTWYRLEETWSAASFTDETLERWLTLIRIGPDGNTMERQSSLAAFPETFGRANEAGGYGTYTRE